MSWLNGGRRGSPGPGDENTSQELARLRRREHGLQVKLDNLRSMLRMTASLNATLNYDRVLELVLDLGTAVLKDTKADDTGLVSALLLFDDETLQVVSARGLTRADKRVRFPATEGLIAAALSTGKLQATRNPTGDPELCRLAGMQTCRSVVCLPLAVGLEIYGLLLFAHPLPGYFNGERQELLAAVSSLAIGALQNAKLYSDLEKEKERITEIHEDARKKLARDLHDGPTQSISAIAMRVNFARRLMERQPKEAADELFQIEELARRTTKEIRQMLFTLRPLALEAGGLNAALEDLASKTLENMGQKVEVDTEPGAPDELDLGKQGVLFFIAEEAVNNARKHAEASVIAIRLKRDGELLLMEIEDNGSGFDVAAVNASYHERGSLGMINLRERAELVNGLMRIESTPGRGTRISVIVPLTPTAAERLHRPSFAA
ncbi:MAG TPA: GAF domain-containing sensor histidine kinase [Anaerolineales bacterium]|nr:GAF domain-containing sensor histidine kinase [Anaerolineales bacterium]